MEKLKTLEDHNTKKVELCVKMLNEVIVEETNKRHTNNTADYWFMMGADLARLSSSTFMLNAILVDKRIINDEKDKSEK